MILEGSRYENTVVRQAPGWDGVWRPTMFTTSRRGEEEVSFFYHTVLAGDRLEALAARYFGDPLLWWMIANANPELIFPEGARPGYQLRIPVP